MGQVEVEYWWRQAGRWAGWRHRIVWLMVAAVLVVGATVVVAVVVPRDGWEWVGLMVVMVAGVGQRVLEEVDLRGRVVEVQSEPAFCV